MSPSTLIRDVSVLPAVPATHPNFSFNSISTSFQSTHAQSQLCTPPRSTALQSASHQAYSAVLQLPAQPVHSAIAQTSLSTVPQAELPLLRQNLLCPLKYPGAQDKNHPCRFPFLSFSLLLQATSPRSSTAASPPVSAFPHHPGPSHRYLHSCSFRSKLHTAIRPGPLRIESATHLLTAASLDLKTKVPHL